MSVNPTSETGIRNPENQTPDERRVRRMSLSLPVRVEGKDDPQTKWGEITRLTDISPFGAGFNLKRPVKRGRLVQLTLPMPRKMRCYDYVEPQYRVWGIVRRCLRIDETSTERYFIGAAFIGKNPPLSYVDNPSNIYEISNQAKDGLWTITNAPEIPDETHLAKEDRRHSRYGIPVDMTVEIIDTDGTILTGEPTVSENISLSGASVFTSLDVEKGTYLRITSPQYNTSIKAIVRGTRTGMDSIQRLHIEFIDDFFPLEGIEL